MIKGDDIMPDVSYFVFYTDAFRELSTCRQIGFSGAGPIPFSSILEYTKAYEIDDFDEFLFVIRRMDSEYLNQCATKDKASVK